MRVENRNSFSHLHHSLIEDKPYRKPCISISIIHHGYFFLRDAPSYYYPKMTQYILQSGLGFVNFRVNKKKFTKSKIHRFEYILHIVFHIVWCLPYSFPTVHKRLNIRSRFSQSRCSQNRGQTVIIIKI